MLEVSETVSPLPVRITNADAFNGTIFATGRATAPAPAVP